MKLKLLTGIIGLFLSTVVIANPLYKKCSSCHGENGEFKAMGKSKIIKDMNSTEIKNSLIGYKNGTYGGPLKGLMKGQVLNLTNKEIKELSEYISTLGNNIEYNDTKGME